MRLDNLGVIVLVVGLVRKGTGVVTLGSTPAMTMLKSILAIHLANGSQVKASVASVNIITCKSVGVLQKFKNHSLSQLLMSNEGTERMPPSVKTAGEKAILVIRKPEYRAMELV